MILRACIIKSTKSMATSYTRAEARARALTQLKDPEQPPTVPRIKQLHPGTFFVLVREARGHIKQRRMALATVMRVTVG